MLQYENLTLTDLNKLEKDKTIFLMAVSPLEVHGPHLPLGTDVFIAEHLLQRYVAELEARHPDFQLIKIPPLFTGANPLPIPGSIEVKASTLEKLLYDFGRSLAKQGFHYLFLADNHGGPGHQLAIEAAARKLWKRYHFYLVNPFGRVFRYMVQHDQAFREETGLGPGKCGDDPDSHAGTNETSLMLAVNPEQAGNYAGVDRSTPPAVKGISGLLNRIGRLISRTETGRDLIHLANTLAWVGDKQMKPYMGSPAEASLQAGQAMLEARVKVAIELFEQALQGERLEIRPMLWRLRILRKFS